MRPRMRDSHRGFALTTGTAASDDEAVLEVFGKGKGRRLKYQGTASVVSVARSDRVLVTGATGLLGSHLAERLVARGDRVRALVRPGSRTDFLDTLGVEIVRGDLTDPAACQAAVAGVVAGVSLRGQGR